MDEYATAEVAQVAITRVRLRGASSARIAARRRPGRGGGGPCLGRYCAPDAARSPPRCAGTGGRAIGRYKKLAGSFNALPGNIHSSLSIFRILETRLYQPAECL